MGDGERLIVLVIIMMILIISKHFNKGCDKLILFDKYLVLQLLCNKIENKVYFVEDIEKCKNHIKKVN